MRRPPALPPLSPGQCWKKLLPWVCRIRTERLYSESGVSSPGGTAQTALTVHLLTSSLCKVANKQQVSSEISSS